MISPSAVFPFLLFFAGAVSAQAREHVETFLSRQGETVDAFVVRLAPALNKYTAALGAEVCGVLETQSDGTTKLDIYTSHMAEACYFEKGDALTVHTHPSLKVNRNALFFSKQDWTRAGYLVNEVYVKFHNTKRQRTVVRGL